METFTEIFNQIMSFGVFALIPASAALICALARPRSAFGREVSAFVSAHILWLGFGISFAAIVSSLIYSNVIGFAPCLLCWYARIALYPQAILYGLAILKKDGGQILDQSLALTGFGILVTGYHTVIENVGYTLLPCTTDGASCLARPVHEYGFITIPVMALSACVALFLSALVAKRASKTSAELTS